MKIWEIKAQSLRLMFADSDIQFSEEDFSSEKIYDNPNTREKLTRMDDSIRRAIDLYYEYNSSLMQMTEAGLIVDGESYENAIDCSTMTGFGFPTRVDLKENTDGGIRGIENIPFLYDKINNKIYFDSYAFVDYGDDIQFFVYYRREYENLPETYDEMTYDLNVLYIPNEVQRQMPYFVKAELYEEDEPETAMLARRIYTNFLTLNQRKNFGKVRTKVKKTFPWGSE